MTGYLVVNASLSGEKFDILHKHLVLTAAEMGILLKMKNNEEMLFETQKADFVLFWDKDIALARLLEAKGLPVFNSARSIALCDNKALTYAALLGVVPQPKTIAAPLTFFAAEHRNFVHRAVQALGLPVVFKECYGSFGAQVFLCRSEEEVLSHVTRQPFLLQEFVAASRGEDIRLEIVDGKCVAAMQRKNENDFRSNLTNGGSAAAYTPTESEVQTAVAACDALGLTFGGVDMLNNGAVCEVNSNAHIMNLLQVTGTDVAPLLFETIEKKICTR